MKKSNKSFVTHKLDLGIAIHPEELNLNEYTKEELYLILEHNYLLSDIWSTTDLDSLAEEMEDPLKEFYESKSSIARKSFLQEVIKKVPADVGINWDYLETCLKKWYNG